MALSYRANVSLADECTLAYIPSAKICHAFCPRSIKPLASSYSPHDEEINLQTWLSHWIAPTPTSLRVFVDITYMHFAILCRAA